MAAIRARLPVPAENELERLALESLLSFREAVQAQDFTAFHATLADALKREAPPDRLRKSFHEFIDRKIDIAPIKAIKPVFKSSTVDERGQLTVAGHYPTEPLQVRFRLTYVHERGGWKLVGIDVHAGKKAADN